MMMMMMHYSSLMTGKSVQGIHPSIVVMMRMQYHTIVEVVVMPMIMPGRILPTPHVQPLLQIPYVII